MTILNYVIKMILSMLMILPFLVIIRIIYNVLKKNKSISYKHEILVIVFFLFLFSIYFLAIFKDVSYIRKNGFKLNIKENELNLMLFKVIIVTFKEVFIRKNINYFLINFLGNILVFIPIGFLIPNIWKINGKKVVLIGFLISLSIELFQLFLPRTTDVDDLFLNTLGTIIGYLLYKLIIRKNKNGKQL